LPFWDICAAQRAPVDYADWSDGWAELGRPDITAASMACARDRLVRAALGAIAALADLEED
jgi:hypothetical protein